MSLPRYPKYKDSGVPWIGDIPEHWSVVPFKRQLERNDGGAWGEAPTGDRDTVVLRSTEQTADGRWHLEEPALRQLTTDEIQSTLLVEGDLLLTKSSGSALHIGKTTLVTAAIAALNCCYSNFMQRLRTAITLSPKLAWYLLNNDIGRRQFDLLSNSTTGLANINSTIIGQITVPVPPLAEQCHIVQFLNRETAKIDELVAKQRRLIELLKEKRQAVISDAVTKGLNLNAPMKASGVEWLGDIPAHWQIDRMKRSVACCKNGVWGDEPNGDSDDIRCVRVADFDRDRLRVALREPTYRSVKTAERVGRELSAGNLLLEKSGGGETQPVGAVVLYDDHEPAVCSNFVARMELTSEMSPSYWRYLHAAAYRVGVNTRSIKQTSGIQNLDQQQYLDERAPFPPYEEQVAIAEWIESELDSLDVVIAEASRAIKLFEERRSVLVTAALTGAIDVRQLAEAEAA